MLVSIVAVNCPDGALKKDFEDELLESKLRFYSIEYGLMCFLINKKTKTEVEFGIIHESEFDFLKANSQFSISGYLRLKDNVSYQKIHLQLDTFIEPC